MKHQKRKVAVIGALNVDIGGHPEAAFVPGDSIPGRVKTTLGGVGWNIARNCASLGAEAAFFSVLGEDGNAALIRADAAEYGVSLRGCRWVEAENNRYLYIRGKTGEMVAAVNDMSLCERMDAAFAAERLDALNGFHVIVADANLPTEAFHALASGCTAPLVADCVSAVKCGRLRDDLSAIHTLKANRMEAEMLTGRIDPEDCVRALLDRGVGRVVVSMSGEGALCGEDRRVFRVPASGMPVQDVTGAGDSLTAALAAGLAYGLPLEESAALGMRAAGVTMGRIGAVTKDLTALAI